MFFFTAIFLWVANATMFRGWMAGSFPAINPGGWHFTFVNHLCWAAAAAFAAVGSFIAISSQKPRQRWGSALLIAAALLASAPAARELIAVDGCLDSGGLWLDQQLRCTHDPAEL